MENYAVTNGANDVYSGYVRERRTLSAKRTTPSNGRVMDRAMSSGGFEERIPKFVINYAADVGGRVWERTDVHGTVFKTT